MSEYVDCRTCKTDCVRADGNYGYTFCDKYTHPPMTNADRIRAMSDEEIAEYVCRNSINTLCDIICGGECNAISTLKRSGDWACKEIVMKWLQQPAEEDNHA